jgi:hypothetical protein
MAEPTFIRLGTYIVNMSLSQRPTSEIPPNSLLRLYSRNVARQRLGKQEYTHSNTRIVGSVVIRVLSRKASILLRMQSSWMLRRMVLVRTDVSKSVALYHRGDKNR